jgi:hypothetical protein
VEAFHELMLVPAPPAFFAPFTCRVTFTALVEYPGWHEPQVTPAPLWSE